MYYYFVCLYKHRSKAWDTQPLDITRIDVKHRQLEQEKRIALQQIKAQQMFTIFFILVGRILGKRKEGVIIPRRCVLWPKSGLLLIPLLNRSRSLVIHVQEKRMKI